MEGGKEMVVLGGGDVHHRRDARRPRLSQERDITPEDVCGKWDMMMVG